MSIVIGMFIKFMLPLLLILVLLSMVIRLGRSKTGKKVSTFYKLYKKYYPGKRRF